jgi:Na+:H+ antiporter, NhaA family
VSATRHSDGPGPLDPVPAGWRENFGEFLHTEVAGAIALLAATVIALVCANTRLWPAYDAFWHIEVGISAGHWAFDESLVHWVNDLLMALFFFVVGLEIKREVLVGELSDRRKAVLPVVAAIGGMLAPALIYILMNQGGDGAHGWGIPMATDIAFAVGVMALLGDRVPPTLKVFLVALAIADDIGAILVIAIFYSSGISYVWLGVAVLLLVALLVMNRAGIDSPVPYLVLGGFVWAAIFASGIHSTIAGVLVALTIPAVAKTDPLAFVSSTRDRLDRIETTYVEGSNVLEDDDQQLEALRIRSEASHTAAPLQRLEFALHPFTTFVVLPLFALSNAGVRIVGTDVRAALVTPVALGVIFGLLVGKPLGIALLSWAAIKARIADLPEGVGWPHMLGAGLLGGIGFTMSLFVASLAFRRTDLIADAKLAILVASALAGVLGYVVLRSVSSRRTPPAEKPAT